MTNIKIVIALILFLLLVFSCKSKSAYSEKKDCFYENDGFIYLNFYNSSENERLVPNITGVIDNNFELIKYNYNLSNDTLQIKLLDFRKVTIADSDPSSIAGSINYIKIKKNSKKQQAFKSNKKFEVVSLEYYNEKLNLNRCN